MRFETVLTPQEYVNLVTGKNHIICEGTVDEIEQILEKNGLNEFWNYPLGEMDHIVENNLEVVLVKCIQNSNGLDAVNEELIETYRWFEIPSDEPTADEQETE